MVVDRDVNIMALGEQKAGGHDHPDMVVVKIGIGIGAGLIVGGRVYRGAQGAAGDLGHLRRGTDEPCRCGNRGCLEATAGGWAIRRRLPVMLRRGGSHTGTLSPDVRAAGGPCPRDGTPLTRSVVGGRTTVWCPAHQR